jgi:hypothetical protein
MLGKYCGEVAPTSDGNVGRCGVTLLTRQQGHLIKTTVFQCTRCQEESDSPWIPVEKRLPELDTPVLAIAKGARRYITTTMRIDTEEGWAFAQLCDTYQPDLNDPGAYEFDDDYEYTHWMPLPAPPEALQEG